METEFNTPGYEGENKNWNKDENMGDTPGIYSIDNKGLEQDGPNKDGHFNVLNPDGSFADYAEKPNDPPHNDTNDGTLGIGK